MAGSRSAPLKSGLSDLIWLCGQSGCLVSGAVTFGHKRKSSRLGLPVPGGAAIALLAGLEGMTTQTQLGCNDWLNFPFRCARFYLRYPATNSSTTIGIKMQQFLSLQGFVALGLLFFVSGTVRHTNAKPIAVLGGSIVLIAVAIVYLHFYVDMTATVELMASKKLLSDSEHGEAKTAMNVWNAVIALVVGGVGVNMFSTWVTTVNPEKA